MTDWQALTRRLAEKLTADRALTDPLWRAAFEAVPRHVFVPRFYGDDGAPIDSADPNQRDAWLDAVYQDTSLVTKLATAPGTDLQLSISSSTMPSLMARRDLQQPHRTSQDRSQNGSRAVSAHSRPLHVAAG